MAAAAGQELPRAGQLLLGQAIGHVEDLTSLIPFARGTLHVGLGSRLPGHPVTLSPGHPVT
ncbi:MAG: hypothetical protein ABIV93_01785 [Byssovorax sp.]